MHVDPESDTKGTALQQWPERAVVVEAAQALCRANALALHDVKLHYLNNGLEADVIVEGLREPARSGALGAQGVSAMEPSSQIVADALAARFGLRSVRVLRVTGETLARPGEADIAYVATLPADASTARPVARD